MTQTFERLSLTFVLLLIAGGTAAQDALSLERTYAALCGAQTDQGGEACVALRKAIADKEDAATHQGARQADAAWGLYAELAGKTWVVVDKSAFNSFYIVKFRQERDRLVSDSTLYTAAVQVPTRSVITRLVDGRLQAEGTNAFGMVANDGSVVFSTRSAFGREKPVSSVRRVNGEIVSLFMAEPKRPFVYNEITDAEIPELVAQWHARRKAREQERAAASQARWDHFNAVLAGVTAALSEVQNVTRTLPVASAPDLGNAVVTGNAASSPVASASMPSNATRKFGWCVAIQPGTYMDAPGAMFLSEIDEVDWSGHQASEAANAFGDAVAARFGAHPGSASCNSWGSRAEAETRWREQHDNTGLSAYKKVETGISAAR